jgi:hypothetical protein
LKRLFTIWAVNLLDSHLKRIRPPLALSFGLWVNTGITQHGRRIGNPGASLFGTLIKLLFTNVITWVILYSDRTKENEMTVNLVTRIWQTMNLIYLVDVIGMDTESALATIRDSIYQPISENQCVVTTDQIDFLMVVRDGKVVNFIEIIDGE